MYEKLIKGSDELKCTEKIVKYGDGIVQIGGTLLKDGNMYSVNDFMDLVDHWEKLFEKKPTTEEIFNELDPLWDERYESDFETTLSQNSPYIHCEESKFEFDGKKIETCNYYFQPYVNAYEETREYGGPEEGGWYYTQGRCIKSVPVFSKKDVDYITKMLKGIEYQCMHGTLAIGFGCEKGTHYPHQKPMYS